MGYDWELVTAGKDMGRNVEGSATMTQTSPARQADLGDVAAMAMSTPDCDLNGQQAASKASDPTLGVAQVAVLGCSQSEGEKKDGNLSAEE